MLEAPEPDGIGDTYYAMWETPKVFGCDGSYNSRYSSQLKSLVGRLTGTASWTAQGFR